MNILTNIEYPNPCCRCGYCCMVELCPIVLQMIGSKSPPCPYLEIENDEFACGVARELSKTYPKEKVDRLFGFGKGCCIKARAYKDGVQYDFASLPAETKKAVAKSLWNKWGKYEQAQVLCPKQ